MLKILILIFAIFAICNASPIGDDILARLNQLSELRNQINQAKEAFTRFNEVASQTHRNNMDIIQNTNMKRDSRASLECTLAIANLTTVYLNGSCALYYTQYFTASSATDKQTAVTNFCGNCQNTFNQAVKRVISVCNLTDTDEKVLRAVGFYPRFLCAQVNGQFCANVINDVVAQVPADINEIKDDVLAKVCTPCVSVALNVLQQGSLIANAVYFRSVVILRGVCVKFGGKFCFTQIRDNYNNLLQVAAKFNSTTAEINAGDFKKVLEFFCAPCYRLFASRVALSNGFTQLTLLQSFKVIGSLCRKNPAREFCFVKLFDNAKPLILAGATGGKLPCDNSFVNGTCSEECKNYVKNFVNKGGCCWSVLIDAISGTGPGTDSPIKQAIINAIKQCVPDLTIPEPCISVAKAKIKITYTNLVVNAANQAAFIQGVLADIAVSIGGYDSVNSASITVTNNKRANEVVVTVPDVTTAATLGGALTYSESTCSGACNAASIADPSADVTVRSETSDLSVQSSSSILTFSFALLFILSLFLF